MADKIVELLKAVDAVRAEMAEAHARRLASGAEFNVYELCGVSHYELMHSKILAEILNPSGMHGQGVRFLKLFSEEFGLSDFSDTTKVSLEVKGFIGNKSIGRFDIYLEDKDAVCIIENKIYAGEQDQQLARYRSFLDDDTNYKHMAKDKRHLVFLTLDGRDALTLTEGYVKAAYCAKDRPSVCHWLDKCAEGVAEMIAVPLRLYRNHVTELALGETLMKENVAKCLIGNIETASLILKHYDDAVIEVKQRVMDAVTEALPDSIKCAIDGDGSEWCNFKVKQYNRQGVSGWAYRVNGCYCHVKNAEAWLRVFIDDDYCQVGVFADDFCAVNVKKRFQKWCQKNIRRLESSGWYSESAYPLYRDVVDVDGRSYKFDPQTLDRIANEGSEGCQGKLVKQIVKAIEDLYCEILEFEKAYNDEP